MGCDIHFHGEVKIDGKWHHYSAPNIPRSYQLFAKMADVRNYGDIVPICRPRGLPPDASVVTALEAKNYGRDGHSHSFLMADEVAELEQWAESHLLDSAERWKFHDRFWGYLFGNTWSGFVTHPEERPQGVEDVRFVFWFDN